MEWQTRDFDQLETCLQAADADSGAAAAHGLLCGMVTAGGKRDPAVWLEHLLGTDNTLSVAAQDCSDMLENLLNDILGQLNDESFGFSVLLPPDHAPMSVRTRALGEWCEGYLFGLALGGIRKDSVQAGAIGEIMKDFYEISHAGFVSEGPDEADEDAYVEIVEYVRVSVLLLYEDMQAVPAPAGLQ